MAREDLDRLRTELSGLDRQLIELVARRSELSLEIGRLKAELGRGTRDFAREKVVLERARGVARELGAPEALAERLMIELITSSLSLQEQDRVASAGSGAGKRALVIGGAGKMGRWFVGFLAAQGYLVTVADPTPVADGLPWVADWRALPLDHDLVVVASPLAATNEVLLALAERGPSGVVFDIGSLKTPLRSGLLALRDAGVQVTSVHPMFGPDTSLLSGRHVLFVDVGVPEATRAARELFAATMAEQADMDLDTHDRLIAYVLGLSHALNLAFVEALASSGEDLPLLARISSTTFDAQLGVSARVAQENPHLYFEIQALNAYGGTSLDALDRAVTRVRELVGRGDEPGFVALMERGRDYVAQRAGRP
ncbi:MAG: prephenate dehydrogenase/arogenate dehydrogenase family protein [Alphaproteobacteria bacterium]|nr:prephenate dehydrogenase/arogenate dehydrogenase family protein [Alphaproteobacteria bacterium]